MSGKRGTAPCRSKDGSLSNGDANEVYASLQGARSVEYLDELPDLDGHATILPRGKKLIGGGPLPHSNDVRAVLRRALTTLDSERSKRPEIRYLRLALHWHLDHGASLDQAFGYARIGKGAAPFDQDRARQIACAVFDQRFIAGKNAETAGYEAGKSLGVSKTQALAAFANHASHALRVFKANRQASHRKPLWTSDEERRLARYYKKKADWLESQPDK